MNQVPATIQQKIILFLIVIIIISTSLIIFILLPSLKQKSVSRSTYLSSSCIILPEKYCSQAKLIEWTDPTDKTTYLFVAFNLPAETPLFAGADGMLNKSVEGDAPFTGNRSTVIDRSFSPPVVIDIRVADMVYDNGKIPAEEKVKKGQKFGKVGNNGKKHAGPFADFNTLISLSIKGSDGKFSPPREMYKKYFKKL